VTDTLFPRFTNGADRDWLRAASHRHRTKLKAAFVIAALAPLTDIHNVGWVGLAAAGFLVAMLALDAVVTALHRWMRVPRDLSWAIIWIGVFFLWGDFLWQYTPGFNPP
jgi:hypothetical protein